jgi:uncharacterized protein involved in exopolysaccharide biosynthesis
MEVEQNKLQEEDQIDIIALLSKIWARRKFIFKITTVFAVLGVLVALFTLNTYTASSMFTPNSGGEASGSGGLKGLASLAGINLGSASASSKEISPMLYGKILESATFKRQLLETPLKNLGKVKTLRGFFEKNTGVSILGTVKEYTIGLPGKIIGVFKEDQKAAGLEMVVGVTKVSEEDDLFYEAIDAILTLNINDKDGFIEMIAKSKNPQVAAQVAKSGERILQNLIIEIQTKSSLELLVYLEAQYAEKRAALTKAQDQLSSFKDRNLNIGTSSFSNIQRRLETELQTVTAVFQNIVTQFEQVKLQVAKDTPVFSILKPVVFPNEKSGPKRILIVVIWLFLGAVLSVGFVLGKEPLLNLIKEIKAKNYAKS